MSKKLVLIDSYALIYRAYYAFINRPIFAPNGLNTSVIYGFLITLDDILRRENPTHLGAAFDISGVDTFRHKLYPAYKANREKTPEEIQKSVPIIKDILQYMNIPILQVEGYEADDVIGTLAEKALQHNFQVLIVTPDKDYAQLVKEGIKIYKPKKAGNDAEILDVEAVKKNFSINDPRQVIDILALWGDASDNVPGVKGIGEVTAKKLIAQYHSIENLLNHLNELNQSQREKIAANAEMLKLSKQLVTIDTQVPIDFDEKLLERKPFDEKSLKKLLEELNFKSFLARFFPNNTTAVESKKQSTYIQTSIFDSPTAEHTQSSFDTLSNVPHQYHLINNEEQIDAILEKLSQCHEFCFDTETTGLSPHVDQLAGVSFCFVPHEAYYLALPQNWAHATRILEKFKPYFENPSIRKIGHNLKFDILFLHRYEIEVKGPLFDTMLAHYLIQPEQSHKLDNLARKYLNYSPIPIENLIGSKGISQLKMNQVPLDQVCDYACEDADVSLQLKPILEKELAAHGIEELFYQIESRLLEVLIDMEKNGFALDVDYLYQYKKILIEEIIQLENQIFALAGTPFNIASPRQLGEILFEHLKIPYEGKLTKTKQYSTNEETLQQLIDKHPIVEKILDYRGLTKLLSTYVDALPKLINPNTGKIHTSFNQTLTVTGRLSSNNPNLQNIPIRDEKGREIRKAFIPSEGNLLLSADYSQIELRIIAHMSNDTNMIEAFLSDADIHAATAAKIFKVPLEAVDREQRRKAKTANFGIIYGISAFGLAQRMNISRKEASDLIAEYFKTFPGVQRYMTEIIQFAREKGYVETLFKRRRYLPDIHSQNATVRGMAERNAINSPIQGSAADIIKVAMINIFDKMRERKLKTKMILQVHDELVFDVFPSELDEVTELVRYEMEHAYTLKVPLKVDVGVGKNWLEAH
ncbi:MAG TPA: DNA polymerase I [Bacteroidales bacterium]|mgnify:CR=1 FL=1|nr:DNA polymerase I [Bacteroidales bacterium]